MFAWGGWVGSWVCRGFFVGFGVYGVHDGVGGFGGGDGVGCVSRGDTATIGRAVR